MPDILIFAGMNQVKATETPLFEGVVSPMHALVFLDFHSRRVIMDVYSQRYAPAHLAEWRNRNLAVNAARVCIMVALGYSREQIRVYVFKGGKDVFISKLIKWGLLERKIKGGDWNEVVLSHRGLQFYKEVMRELDVMLNTIEEPEGNMSIRAQIASNLKPAHKKS